MPSPTLLRPPAPATLAAPGPTPLSPLKVLVVEDYQDMADSLCLVLQLLGYDARAAYSGPDGVRMAAEFRPDVVVSDIGLPGLDGYEVARRVRQLPGLDGVLLVAVTAYGSAEDRRRGREAGFDHYLVKPVDLCDIRGVLPA
jgi:two-component system CheB/CheR fusion protein